MRQPREPLFARKIEKFEKVNFLRIFAPVRAKEFFLTNFQYTLTKGRFKLKIKVSEAQIFKLENQ